MATRYMTETDINRFKGFMVGAGYNVSTLAEAVGMSREILSSRINGRTDFARSEMIEIAETLHKTPQEIFLN